MKFIQTLTEGIRTPHPEDSIFSGSAEADRYIKALGSVIANPANVTIKWDGFPALIFGRLRDGRFTIQDKYMFDNKFFADSPKMWEQYDLQKKSGNTRPDLYAKLQNIWRGLEQAVGNSSGFFWGDLLWSEQLPPHNGVYSFKPNVVEYRVPIDSPLGKKIKRSVGGIVVHQYFADDSARPAQWNGQGLTRNGSVVVLTPSAGIQFKLDDPVQLSKAASAAVNQYSNLADQFLAELPGVVRQALQK